ncbi:DUF397 domain-containing protein [Streptomyces sp. NPDC057249]|uniref:DUF397 domain-containing protein n=1 Tax=Streptomyces sp. NPDC057249 TaxID=3346067 RepID=UPI0036288693
MTNNNAPQWFKSSYSEGSGNACVEVALNTSAVLVRDSKDVTIPNLKMSAASWSAFLSHATR